MNLESTAARVSAPGSVAELYDREHGAMVRLARLIVGSVAIAEEIVHDAFVAVLEREATIAIENHGAYLRKVVVNNCHSLTRRTLTGRDKVAQLAASERARSVELPPVLDETWQALVVLTQKQRTAIVLRYYADYPIAEVARLMG
ncbi:MAG: hypothetical protein GY926_26830, partial [bacterium]|nr:hypothetical protein [bacterium]